MRINEKVLERIVCLKDSQGMGYRKISEQLKKEGLASIGKSTVAAQYNRYAPKLKKETEEELDENEEFKNLKEKMLKIEKEVKLFQALDETRRKIKESYLKKARTWQGLQDIFSTPAKMLEFTQATIDNYRSVVLKNPDVFESLVAYCRNNNLPLAKTLSQIVGSLKEYQADADNDGTLLGLDNYVGLQLDFFLGDRQEEGRIKALQKKFEDHLMKAQCPRCSRPLAQTFKYGKITRKTLLIMDGLLSCQTCEARLEVLCPSCKSQLGYKGEYDFYCSSCDLTFALPNSEVKNRDLGIKMRIIYPHSIE